MTTSIGLIELTDTRRRVDSYRFDLLDVAMNKIGTVTPDRDTPPSITVNTDNPIHRSMQGLHLNANVQADIDVLSARVAPVMVLQDGSEWPRGVFLFGDAPLTLHSWGQELDGSLVDQRFILNQPIGRVYGANTGANIVATAQMLAAEVIVGPMSVASSSSTLGAPIAWKPEDTRLAIINALLARAAYLPVYFDNSGTLVMTPQVDPALVATDLDYEIDGRIIKDSIIESNSLLTAPNRWVVVDTSATDSPVIGTYDLPNSAPNSYAARGIRVTHTISQPGVGTLAQAQAAAQAAALQDVAMVEVDFDSTDDPRHDIFSVVTFLGNQCREVGWKLAELRSGAKMTHNLRRAFS